VLQVFFVTAMFPHFAIDLTMPAGRFRLARDASEQPPDVPYLVAPLTGFGVKPATVGIRFNTSDRKLLCAVSFELFVFSCGGPAELFAPYESHCGN
jgi:hypothetical protein